MLNIQSLSIRGVNSLLVEAGHSSAKSVKTSQAMPFSEFDPHLAIHSGGILTHEDYQMDWKVCF